MFSCPAQHSLPTVRLQRGVPPAANSEMECTEFPKDFKVLRWGTNFQGL